MVAKTGRSGVRQFSGNCTVAKPMTANRMGLLLRHLWLDEAGQDLVEYALCSVFVGLGVVIAMKNVATNIGLVFSTVGTTLTTAL
jgi:Flp pilus assembly pilin Flp